MNFKNYIVVILISVLALGSCSKKTDDDKISLDTSSNTFVANIEGEAFNAFAKQAVLKDGYLTVYGQSSNGSIICVRTKLYNYEPTDKTYILSNHSDHFISYDFGNRFDTLVYWSKNNPEDLGQSGDVLISKIDLDYGLVSGTFKTRVYSNFDKNQQFYLSQGSFTDIMIVDSLTIDNYGMIGITNSSGGTGGGGGGDVILPTDNYVKCKVNGVDYNSTSTNITSNYGMLMISGNINTQFKSINIQMPVSIAVGTYDISNPLNSVSINYSVSSTAYSLNPIGTLDITEKTTEHISGTFTVSLTNTNNENDVITLENGQFSMSLLQ
ncbi:MAG: hypothetical protein JXR60_05140 [Bacteroidales bacterium]|nr:hypothetical protein [Bacteroidales bacterium]